MYACSTTHLWRFYVVYNYYNRTYTTAHTVGAVARQLWLTRWHSTLAVWLWKRHFHFIWHIVVNYLSALCCCVFQRRTWARLDLWEWAFVVVSILNITLCIILSTLRLVNVIQQDPNSPDFIFTIVLIVNSGIYSSRVSYMYIMLEEFRMYYCFFCCYCYFYVDCLCSRYFCMYFFTSALT